MKALVTGASGFIGRNLASKLRSMGYEVIGIDFVKYEDVIVRDIRSNLDDLMYGIDVVFHEAAITSPPQFEENPRDGMNTNVLGTYNVLEAAAKRGVKRAVIASSSAIYGSTNVAAIENMRVSSYNNLYPITKLFDEYLAGYFSARNELDVISLRYFNTYGKGENSKGAYSSVVSKFIADLQSGRKPVIFGDGTQSRDFVYVEDVVEANILAMQKGESGGVYNVGTGVSSTFKDILAVANKVMSMNVEADFVKNPFSNYQNFTLADTRKSETVLGFHAKYTLESGIRKILGLQ